MNRRLFALPHVGAVAAAAATLWITTRFMAVVIAATAWGDSMRAVVADRSWQGDVVWALLLAIALAFGQEAFAKARTLAGALLMAMGVAGIVFISTVAVHPAAAQAAALFAGIRGVGLLAASALIHYGRRWADATAGAGRIGGARS